jgi:molybdopterin/thiamine biosynthesis adenylyltransferase
MRRLHIKLDNDMTFDYREAFRINSGIITDYEQDKLRNARVLIVGVGGAGGTIAVMLARSGFSHFTLVDFDTYSLSNINRQIGCFIDTLGRYKVDVIKEEILRINPEAEVTAISRRLELEELDKILDVHDVYFSEADDLAYSTHSLIMAQKKHKLAISFMPSGLTGYVMVFPPGLKRIYDPTDMFGGPAGLNYEELKAFQTDTTCRSGRKWHISQGKMRVEWYRNWCERKAALTQLCPAVWAGASLATIEAIKHITGKWQKVKAPLMWQMELGENRIRAVKFRKRSWLFSKYIYRAMRIKVLGVGKRIEGLTRKSLEKDLARMEKEEAEGKCPRLPFMWKHVI